MSGCVWGSSSGHNFPGYDFCLFVRALQVRGEGIGLQAEWGIFPEEGALIAMRFLRDSSGVGAYSPALGRLPVGSLGFPEGLEKGVFSSPSSPWVPLARRGVGAYHPDFRCVQPFCGVRCAGAARLLARLPSAPSRATSRVRVWCSGHWPRAWQIWGLGVGGSDLRLESGSGSGASTWVSVSVGPPPAGRCVWSEPKGSGFCPEQNCSLWGERPVTNPRASQLFLLRRDCWAVSAGAGMWSPEGVWLPKCSQQPEWRASPALGLMSVLAKTGSGWSRFGDELSPAVCLVVVWNVFLEIRPQV